MTAPEAAGVPVAPHGDLDTQSAWQAPASGSELAGAPERDGTSLLGSSQSGSRAASIAADAPGSEQRRSTRDEAADLVKARYQQFLATQILASNLGPLAHFYGVHYVATLSHIALAAVTCLVVSSCLALLFLYARVGDAARDALLTALVRLEHAQMSVLSLALLREALTQPSNCPRGDASAVACASSYFFSAHLTLQLKWVVTQMPVRCMVLPEAARNAAVALATLAAAQAEPPGVSAPLLRAVLARAAAVTLTAPLLCALCHGRTFSAAHLPAALSARERPAGAPGRAADFLARLSVRAAAAMLPEAIMSATAVTGVSSGVLFSLAVNGSLGGGFCDVCRRVNAVVAFSLLVTGAAKLQAGTSTGLDMLERRLGRGSSLAAVASGASKGLEARLADAASERDVLRVGCEAAHALFPQARALALVSLASLSAEEQQHRSGGGGGGGGARPACVEAAALQERERVALAAALADTDMHSSAAFVCGAAGGAPVADSRDWAAGVAAFSDWRAALEGGLAAAQLVTARFSAGAQPAGYALLAFGALQGFPSNEPAALDALRALCDSVGAALLRRRAADAAGAAARRLAHVERLAADIFPNHLLEAVANRILEDEPAPLVERHACVTVIFADVVGWTQQAAGMSPEEAMLLLDRLWQRFDTLCSSHACHKVETIGDSYLAVCGMFPPRRDHAAAALRFALDMHAAAAGVAAAGDGGFSIRVGVHSGPLSSGVVGHLRQRWCIFGDTVNTASRMESSGRPGNVQLSDVTLALAGLDADAVPSRHVDIKGKGPMTTFVLEAGSSEALAARAVLDAAPLPEEDDDDGELSDRDSRSDHDHDHEGASDVDEGAPLRVFAPPGGTPTAVGSGGPGSMSSSIGGSGTRASAEAGSEADAAASRRAHAHAVSALLLGTVGPLGFCTFWCLYLSDGSAAAVAAGALLGTTFVAALPLLAAAHRRALPSAVSLSRPLVLRLCLAACLGCDLVGHALAQQAWCSRVARGPGCELTFFWDFHAIMGATAPLTSMLPVHLALAPELARFGVLVGTALVLQRAHLSAAALARLLLHGAASAALTPAALVCALDVPASVTDALADVETCPAFLRPQRDAAAAFYLQLRERLLGAHEPPLLERTGLVVFCLRVIKVIHSLLTADAAARLDGSAMLAGCRDLNATLLLVMAASALSRVSLRAAGSNAAAEAAQRQLYVAELLSQLRAQLAGACSEAASLAAAATALSAIFPGAAAVAVGAFAQGASCAVLSCLELSADDAAARAALAASLPPDVGGTAGTSVSRACRSASRGAASAVLDSRECERGLAECTDWAAATSNGLDASRALTVPLTAGPVVVGFATVYLSLFHADDGSAAAAHAVLREVAGVVGGALFVRRAFAINRDDGALRPLPATQQQQQQHRRHDAVAPDAAAPAGADAAYPASDADAVALALLDARRAADFATLDSWSLDAWGVPDDELQRLLAAMLHSLGLFRRFRLSPTAFAAFVADAATHYSDNPFHCFRHAFSVTHQCWLFLRDDAARALLLDIDTLSLLLAALCHDLEHPGTTNAYQVNSGSALALRYNDQSVLEAHHAAVGFALLQRSRVLGSLEAEELRCVRRTFVAAVLATDMACHKQLLAKVTAAVSSCAADGHDEAAEPPVATASGRRMSMDAARVRQSAPGGGFARRQPEERQLLVSFLLHCADLGNPLRPPNLSERIAADLQREFEAQAARERAAGLPVTVMLASDDASKAKLELGFLEYVVAPLFVTLAAITPHLGDKCLRLIAHNKAAWNARIGAAQ